MNNEAHKNLFLRARCLHTAERANFGGCNYAIFLTGGAGPSSFPARYFSEART